MNKKVYNQIVKVVGFEEDEDVVELTVKSVSAINGTVIVTFNEDVTKVPKDLMITVNGEELELDAKVVDGKVEITVPKVEASKENVTEVEYTVTLNELTKTVTLAVPPVEMRTVETVETFEDIEIEFSEDYNLPTRVEVTLNDEEVVIVPVEWYATEVNVNKEGTYPVEGKLDFTNVMNLEDEARETKATINIVVSEGKEFDFSVNKGQVLRLSTYSDFQTNGGWWFVEDQTILKIDGYGTVNYGNGTKFYVYILGVKKGYTNVLYINSSGNVIRSSIVKVVD